MEYQEDTNGTLRQFTTNQRGIKTDWGVSVNGILTSLEYDIALTRGSGNEILSKGNPHLFSGRVGTPSYRNFITGISWFFGDVLGLNGITQRESLGFDASYYYYQWQFMVETSVGKTANNNTVNSFGEILWKNAQENISTYLQVGYQRTKANEEVSKRKNSTSYWLAGIQWVSYNGFDISAQYKHKLKGPSTINIDPVLNVQFRYRM